MTLSIHSQLTRMVQSGTFSGTLAAGETSLRRVHVSGMSNNGRWVVIAGHAGTGWPFYFSYVKQIGVGFVDIEIKSPLTTQDYYVTYSVFQR